MKETEKKVVATKGMGLVEATKLCCPKTMKRPSWESDEYVYFEEDGNGEGRFTLYDESHEEYKLTAEDIIATDWEIVK
jgi:hypothetical protein